MTDQPAPTTPSAEQMLKEIALAYQRQASAPPAAAAYPMAPPGFAAPATNGWGGPAPGWGQPQAMAPAPAMGGAVPAVTRVAIPIKLQTPGGSIRIYLGFGPEAASSPQALMATVQALHAAGLPLDIWAPRERESWGNNGGGGGWGGARGGYGGRRF